MRSPRPRPGARGLFSNRVVETEPACRSNGASAQQFSLVASQPSNPGGLRQPRSGPQRGPNGLRLSPHVGQDCLSPSLDHFRFGGALLCEHEGGPAEMRFALLGIDGCNLNPARSAAEAGRRSLHPIGMAPEALRADWGQEGLGWFLAL